MKNFNKWLDQLVDEKDTLKDNLIIKSQHNEIFLSDLVDLIKTLDNQNKEKIKNTLVKIDFLNGDMVDYFKHIFESYIATIKHVKKINCVITI